MSLNKNKRLATAVGFVSGVITSLDALRDSPVTWPPAAAWAHLNHPHRLELGGGIALILVTLIVSARNWQ